VGLSVPAEVADIARRFAVTGQLTAADPFTGGHINDSHLLTYERQKHTTRFLLQRINDAVFAKPALVMDNIQRVTAHIAEALAAQGVHDVGRRVLTLVPTHAGECYCRDADGSYWRLYPFIEGTHVHEAVATAEQARQAGRAFGAFQHLLADLPDPRMHETIPDFHNTPLRFEALERAVQADAYNRAAAAKVEIELAGRHRVLAGVLLDLQQRGGIPERIVHNDAKISNVLFDRQTGDALCVTDLDTVMPGLALYDFGDMVRSMTCAAAEDEIDLSKVEVELPLFEALARGYVSTAGEFLTAAEREQLVFAGKLITLEQAVRFLTDFLIGDQYYKTHRPNHNLERARAQLKLLESIERHEAAMLRLVERC
jgi:Ser/Thr protein kinase RdoA (MazF antagonist)